MTTTHKQTIRTKGRSLLALALELREQQDEASHKTPIWGDPRSDDLDYDYDRVGVYRRAFHNRGGVYDRV